MFLTIAAALSQFFPWLTASFFTARFIEKEALHYRSPAPSPSATTARSAAASILTSLKVAFLIKRRPIIVPSEGDSDGRRKEKGEHGHEGRAQAEA
jgi:hypothetical protein